VIEHFGHNLKKIRRYRDLSQAQLAGLIGIRQQVLSALENGLRPRDLRIVDRCARVLGVDANDLLADRPPTLKRLRTDV
jgi:transcriptional regulator with XRE-family HTH domain